MLPHMQTQSFTTRNITCRIRGAYPEDTQQIRQLIDSSSIHAAGMRKKHAAGAGKHTGPARKPKLFQALSFLVKTRLHWQEFTVAVTGEGAVIGCCRVKLHRCGSREVSTLCIERSFRNGIVATRLTRFVFANSPRPLWGTCMDNLIAFQKRNGAEQVCDPRQMPPFLRRRQRLFNFFLRLAGKRSYLAVMVVKDDPQALPAGCSSTARKAATGKNGSRAKDTPAKAADTRQDSMQSILLQRIAHYQMRRSRPFVFPGLYEAIGGLFSSYPTYTISLFKNHFGLSLHLRVPDNNAFVTFWTLDLLLEAWGGDTVPAGHIRMKDGVRALMKFHDRTRAPDDPLFVFWRQHNVGKHHVAFPANLMPFFRFFMLSDKVLKKIFAAFSKIRPVKSRAAGGHPKHEPKRSSAAFSLPADFDDAALNWSLGSCLSEHKKAYPDAWAAWSENSFDFKKLAGHAVACAYRPFSDDPDARAIDPRSFYAIRTFLWDRKDSGRDLQHFSLLTTWASSVEQNLEGLHRYYKMPFNVNNLDCSVQANFIHAACRGALSGLFPHDVPGFTSLVTDTAQYLAWAVDSGMITDKPDIALLYYPTPSCAFFFISRIVQLLENAGPQGPAAAMLDTVAAALMPAARKHITEHLLSWAVQAGPSAFWERPGQEKPDRALWGCNLDDRKFLTAASVNCLLNLWTRQQGKAILWLPDAPEPVTALAQKGLAWLRQHGLSRSCSDHNAFFSASVKHKRTLPFLFPANRIEHTQGPALEPSISKQSRNMVRHSVYAMSGVPSREEYGRMLQEKGMAEPEPGAFTKCYGLDYPYWSAPSVTSALVCLALSKADALRQ